VEKTFIRGFIVDYLGRKMIYEHYSSGIGFILEF
jgi:hypothetical protein